MRAARWRARVRVQPRRLCPGRHRAAEAARLVRSGWRSVHHLEDERRVEILRALINEPQVLLLDEPYRALDAITKGIMHKFLLDVFDRVQKTIMFITHDLDESVYLADRVGVMTTRPGKFKKCFQTGFGKIIVKRILNC